MRRRFARPPTRDCDTTLCRSVCPGGGLQSKLQRPVRRWRCIMDFETSPATFQSNAFRTGATDVNRNAPRLLLERQYLFNFLIQKTPRIPVPDDGQCASGQHPSDRLREKTQKGSDFPNRGEAVERGSNQPASRMKFSDVSLRDRENRGDPRLCLRNLHGRGDHLGQTRKPTKRQGRHGSFLNTWCSAPGFVYQRDLLTRRDKSGPDRRRSICPKKV